MTKKLTIKVIPRSSKNEIAEHATDGITKIKTTSPPVDGKANEAVIKLLSKKYNTPKSNIHILRGHTSHIKIVEIED